MPPAFDTNTLAPLFITDGLDHHAAVDRYRKRRQFLFRHLEHPLLIVGPTFGPGGNYPWAHIHRTIYQDPYLLYLSGVNQPNTALFLDPSEQKCTLFVPKKNPKLEFWEGRQFGSVDPMAIDDTIGITGVDEVADRHQMGRAILSALGTRETLGLIWNTANGKRRNDNAWADIRPIVTSIKQRRPSLTIQNMASLMWTQRLVMDDVDITNLEIANQKSASAYLTLLSSLQSCETEHDARCHLESKLHWHSEFGTSFPSIIAQGHNAAILHYTKNNECLVPESLLLTDFGVRWHSVHSDITRVAPISGRYSPLQRLLIDITLEAQEVVEKWAAPGVSIHELNRECWNIIQQRLDSEIIKRGGSVRLPYTGSPHNVSHLLGHQVHDGDPSREYRTRPLESGNVISNEPGIYGEFELNIGGVRYRETLGIRIEDDLLITPTGCRNLTTTVKDPDRIAALVTGNA